MVTVDIVVFDPFSDYKILLIKRANAPYQGNYALPGGYVDPEEDLITAAYRELKEETGITDIRLKLLCERSAPERDPRGRTISIVYFGLVKRADEEIKAGDDAAEATWFNFNSLPALAFDHSQIMQIARNRLESLYRKEALLLVDLQNDFVELGALAVQGGSSIISIANKLMSQFELVIATQDWHPANHSSFAANHPWRKPGQVIELEGIRQILWPIHCVQNSYGSLLHQALNTETFEQIFFKGTDEAIDSYSAFYDNARQRSTGLGDYLKARGVEKLYIMGLATDYCVLYSAQDAVQEGFETFIIADGCKAVNLAPDDGKKAIDKMLQVGVKTVLSSQLKKMVRIND